MKRWWRRKTYERDLDKELAFHLESEVRDGLREGLTQEEALRRARMNLGGVEQVKEKMRDTRPTAWVEQWWQDTRYALRAMARAPGFTAAAVLTLAVGIGANTAVWSVLNGLLLRTLPVERPEELYALRRVPPGDGGHFRYSFTGMERLQAAAPEGVRLTAMTSVIRMYATIAGQPEALMTQLVSGEWFQVLGIGAALGRPLGPEDNRSLGGHPVAVVSDGFWTRRFGRDPAVVGRTLRMGGTVLTIVGVMEPGFSGLVVAEPVDIWIPVVMQHQVGYRANASNDNSDTEKPWVPQDGIAWLTLVTRLDAARLPAATGRLVPAHRAWLENLYADREAEQREYGLQESLQLMPISRGLSSLRGQFADPLRALMGGVGLVLLIACANLASLLLARSVARTHEMAVRVSLGARPGRLVRQALTESLTLAILGGALGLALAQYGARAMLRLASFRTTAIPLEIPVDGRVLAFVVGISVLTGFLFGLAPALRSARTDLHDAFKTGSRVVGERAGRRLPLGRILVVSQIALSLVLATGAGLQVRTLRNLLAVDPGYEREQVLSAAVETRAAGFSYAELPGLYQRLRDEVGAVPGIRSVSLSLHGFATGSRRTSGFQVPGRQRDPAWDNSGQEMLVTPEFFSTLGIPVLRGRSFTEADRTPGNLVAIVSESMARHFFDTVDVVGRRIGWGEPAEFEIVGVVRDARANSLRDPPPRLIFYPLAQNPQDYASSVEVRVAGPPSLVIAGLRSAIARVDQGLPIGRISTLDELLGRELQTERMVAGLAGTFSVLALVLAGIGLYGVVAYSVSRRTNEMGVRLALGASPASVCWSVLRDSLGMVALGVAAGAVLWFPLFGLVRSLVFGLSPRDPVSLVLAAGLLVLVGTLAALLPAVRAARVDPVAAVKAE